MIKTFVVMALLCCNVWVFAQMEESELMKRIHETVSNQRDMDSLTATAFYSTFTVQQQSAIFKMYQNIFEMKRGRHPFISVGQGYMCNFPNHHDPKRFPETFEIEVVTKSCLECKNGISIYEAYQLGLEMIRKGCWN